MADLGRGARGVELDGKTYEGEAVDALLGELDDEARKRVFVLFDGGLRIPLLKLEEHQGDDAVRVASGGKVFF